MPTIIAATDFSEKSAHALRFAAHYARAFGASLRCVHVVEELDEGSSWLLLVEPPEQIERDVVQARREKLKEFVTRHVPPSLLEHERVELEVRVGSAIDEILATSVAHDADLIIVGSLGHGVIMATFLGSTANQLVRQSELPVLIVPPSDEIDVQFDHILAPVDDSEASARALRVAGQIAHATGGSVTALHAMNASLAGAGDPGFPVYVGPETLESLAKQRRAWLEGFVDSHGVREHVTQVLVSVDEPAHAIDLTAEKERVDLICMGSHGRRGVRRFLMGNTAERVLRKAPCPVLIIPSASQDA